MICCRYPLLVKDRFSPWPVYKVNYKNESQKQYKIHISVCPMFDLPWKTGACRESSFFIHVDTVDFPFCFCRICRDFFLPVAGKTKKFHAGHDEEKTIPERKIRETGKHEGGIQITRPTTRSAESTYPR